MEEREELIISRLVEISTSFYNSKGLYGFSMEFPTREAFRDYATPKIRETFSEADLELVYRFYQSAMEYFPLFAVRFGKSGFWTFGENERDTFRSKILEAEKEFRKRQGNGLETKVA